MRKGDMITLMARYRRGEAPKQLGFLCRDCFDALCAGLSFSHSLPEDTKGNLSPEQGNAADC